MIETCLFGTVKKRKKYLGGESNPGLPRDRRDTHLYTTKELMTT